MSVHIGDVPNLKKIPTPREQATKVLEEAVEVFAAVDNECKSENPSEDTSHIIEECVDVIIATSNLLACYGVNDLTPALRHKIDINNKRGYISENVS